eukprot:TRINITY_DN15078_c0_g1_i2.p1 TRINITY_DN15078_c0_g1~~TRINITY_DN15078_c0_g1_i2.p1  ORF type:complete len:1013 (-),score=242.10 TRINITY_DN15078_c0_g1_i2:1357-4395(-)
MDLKGIHIYKTGHLSVSSKALGWRSWKKRWFLLTRTALIFFKTEQKGGIDTSLAIGGIDLDNSGSVRVRPEKKSLTLLFPDGRAFTLKAEDAEEVEEWREALEQAILAAPSGVSGGAGAAVGGFRLGDSFDGLGDMTLWGDGAFPLGNRRQPKSLIVGRPILLALEDVDGSPSFLEKALRCLEKQGCTMEGLFRVSANADEVEKRVADYENGTKTEFLEDENPHVVADCVKHVLRELPSPPIPGPCCSALLQTLEVEDEAMRLEALKLATQEAFPDPNRRLLKRVLTVLRLVIANEEHSLMNASAMAACMAPLLLRPVMAGEMGLPTDEESGNNDLASTAGSSQLAPVLPPPMPANEADEEEQIRAATRSAMQAKEIVTELFNQYEHLFPPGEEEFTNSWSLMFQRHFRRAPLWQEQDIGEEDGDEDAEDDDDDAYDEDDAESEDLMAGGGEGLGRSQKLLTIARSIKDRSRKALAEDTTGGSISSEASGGPWASGADQRGRTDSGEGELADAAGPHKTQEEMLMLMMDMKGAPNELGRDGDDGQGLRGASFRDAADSGTTPPYSWKDRRSPLSDAMGQARASLDEEAEGGRVGLNGIKVDRYPSVAFSDSAPLSSEEDAQLQVLELTRQDLRACLSKEVRANAMLRGSLLAKKADLADKRQTLQEEVASLKEQLEAVVREDPLLAGPVQLDEKTQAELAEIGRMEKDVARLKAELSLMQRQLANSGLQPAVPKVSEKSAALDAASQANSDRQQKIDALLRLKGQLQLEMERTMALCLEEQQKNVELEEKRRRDSPSVLERSVALQRTALAEAQIALHAELQRGKDLRRRVQAAMDGYTIDSMPPGKASLLAGNVFAEEDIHGQASQQHQAALINAAITAQPPSGELAARGSGFDIVGVESEEPSVSASPTVSREFPLPPAPKSAPLARKPSLAPGGFAAAITGIGGGTGAGDTSGQASCEASMTPPVNSFAELSWRLEQFKERRSQLMRQLSQLSAEPTSPIRGNSGVPPM